MPGVFISYRRQDSEWPARGLCDCLCEHFGEDRVFMDVDGIEPGEDFVDVLDDALAECDAMIALVGPCWVSITDQSGRRRLEDPEDFVRLEIATALKRKIRVIPVLMDGATMPGSGDLPDELTALVRRQAVEIRAKSFRHCR